LPPIPENVAAQRTTPEKLKDMTYPRL